MTDARLELQHHGPGPWLDTLAQLDRIERKLDELIMLLKGMPHGDQH